MNLNVCLHNSRCFQEWNWMILTKKNDSENFSWGKIQNAVRRSCCREMWCEAVCVCYKQTKIWLKLTREFLNQTRESLKLFTLIMGRLIGTLSWIPITFGHDDVLCLNLMQIEYQFRVVNLPNSRRILPTTFGYLNVQRALSNDHLALLTKAAECVRKYI